MSERHGSKVMELLVSTGSPKVLDETLQSLGGLVGQRPDGTYDEVQPGVYAVRAFPPEKIGFLRFAIERQGYGKIVGEREVQ